MSTDIKPGMEGRAVRDTASMGGTKIPQSTVVTVTALPAEPHLFIGGNGERMGMTLRVDDFLFVPVYGDATPAPLDPSKVKAGDTVTVEVDFSNTDPDVGTVTVAGKVWADYGDNPHGPVLKVGAYSIDVSNVTLTDHQPAPEPEPEWEPGMVAVVIPSMARGKVVRSIRGHEGNWLNEFGGSWDDDEVIDVHELVVVDPADVDRAAIRNALMAEPGAAQGTAHALQVMRIIFTELGIEAP